MPPPGRWRTWLLNAGRGFGKTKTGAETVRAWVEQAYRDGRPIRIALVAPTEADARDVMVEGDSGLIAVSPTWFAPVYEPAKRRLTWPDGSQAFLFSAEKPARLRGPQFHKAWCDELAAWVRLQDTWDMLMFGLRLGDSPQTVVTTTPRPVSVVKRLIADAQDGTGRVVVTGGSTYDNAANLAADFIDEIRDKYEGTRLGRQEIDAHVLTDTPGALWHLARIDELRVAKAPDLDRIVVAIDPPVSSGEKADECGIVVAGVAANRHAYVLADLSERGLSPSEWARKAIAAYRRFDADRIVAEINNGGEMVELTLRQVDANISYRAVRASRGKVTRAEPIAALYDQGRVHHVNTLPRLEDQMCDFAIDFDKSRKGYSPDRVDALVWALTELNLGRSITFHGVH